MTGTSDASDNSKGLSELKSLRSTSRASITRIRQYVNDKKESLSLPELECRLGILESYFKQLLTVQSSIEKLATHEDNVTRGELENSYVETKVSLLSTKRSRQIQVT